MNPCLTCGSYTTNPKFCSRSCAAKYNNKRFPKRKPEHKCKICGVPIGARSRYCKECAPKPMSWLDKPLSECLVKNAGHSSWNFSKIRGYARTIYHKYNPNAKCELCGYDKHVEVCHIKPISSFKETVLLREVNSLENLIGLCPNCHWELDHGLLGSPEFERLQSRAFAHDAQQVLEGGCSIL